MLIDTHTHAWAAPSPTHPWVNGPLVAEAVDEFDVSIVYDRDALRRDMDEVGVDRAVIVGYPITDWTDNDYTRQTAARDRFAGIGMIDPFAANAAETTRELLRAPGMLGIRLGVMCPADRMWQTFDYNATWLRRAIGETAVWEAVDDADGIVQLLAHTSQLDQVRALVDAHPDLTFLIDHFCHADAGAPSSDGAFGELSALAAFDGVAVKLSEIAYFSNEPFPYPDTHEHVAWLLDTFGRERVIWGSDFPNVTHPEYGGMSYAETIEWLEHVDALSATDLDWLTGRAFQELAGF